MKVKNFFSKKRALPAVLHAAEESGKKEKSDPGVWQQRGNRALDKSTLRRVVRIDSQLKQAEENGKQGSFSTETERYNRIGGGQPQTFIIKKNMMLQKRERNSYLANTDTCREGVGFPTEGRALSSGTPSMEAKWSHT